MSKRGGFFQATGLQLSAAYFGQKAFIRFQQIMKEKDCQRLRSGTEFFTSAAEAPLRYQRASSNFDRLQLRVTAFKYYRSCDSRSQLCSVL